MHPSGSSGGGLGGLEQPGLDRDVAGSVHVDAGGVQGVLSQLPEKRSAFRVVFERDFDLGWEGFRLARAVEKMEPHLLKVHAVRLAGGLADAGLVADFGGVDGNFDHDVPRLMLSTAESDRTILSTGDSMEYGKALIDKAGKVCGSFYKLHKETGFSEPAISQIRAGKRMLPLEWVPVLAEIAGEDPRDALARVMAERLP